MAANAASPARSADRSDAVRGDLADLYEFDERLREYEERRRTGSRPRVEHY